MSLKIRLQGSRGKSYRVVVADSRSPRDGRFVENVGHYNPVTEKSIVELNIERIMHWCKQGAQPSNTVKKLISIADKNKVSAQKAQ